MKLRVVLTGPNTPGGAGLWLIDVDDVTRATVPIHGSGFNEEAS
jgi:hypothetical protein